MSAFPRSKWRIDLEYARTRFTREAISQGPLNMWRYRALLPVADSYVPQTPSGLTPLCEGAAAGRAASARAISTSRTTPCACPR